MPASEKRGRRHSSLITVVALEEGNAAEIQVDPRDVRLDTYRDSGPGGQHRNTTDSAVRLTHIPTGVVVTATEERSQWLNKQVAFRRLAEELNRRRVSETHAESNATRRDAHSEFRTWTWTAWRDTVTGPGGVKTSMERALAGRLDPLLKGQFDSGNVAR